MMRFGDYRDSDRKSEARLVAVRLPMKTCSGHQSERNTCLLTILLAATSATRVYTEKYRTNHQLLRIEH